MSLPGDLLGGVGLWVAREERKEEHDDAALQSLLSALNTTKTYIARRERGEPIDRDKEEKLVDLWTAAAVQIHRSDPDLATRLQDKALYWTNPDHWSPEEVHANRIQIDSISKEANRLLRSARRQRSRPGNIKLVVASVVLVLVAAGTAPWWWPVLFGPKERLVLSHSSGRLKRFADNGNCKGNESNWVYITDDFSVKIGLIGVNVDQGRVDIRVVRTRNGEETHRDVALYRDKTKPIYVGNFEMYIEPQIDDCWVDYEIYASSK